MQIAGKSQYSIMDFKGLFPASDAKMAAQSGKKGLGRGGIRGPPGLAFPATTEESIMAKGQQHKNKEVKKPKKPKPPTSIFFG